MRIEHLYLENFGIHKSRRLVFGDGLQVVFGPNESGKTTLLAALRQTLFGMPHISAYAFDGSPVTKARVQLADGRKIELHRKKTRGPGLSGEFEETREPLTVEAWEKCLTGATAGLFENLFAISLQELASGEESLRSAGLAESLFGIAMGGMARFRQLDDRLRDQSDLLFSSSANARKPKINSLIREIQAAERDYEQARAWLFHLNDKYALDGRDANSVGGIMWCLGLWDRPWGNKPVWGGIRPMVTSRARLKFDVDAYIARYP